MELINDVEYSKVKFRQDILQAEVEIKQMIEDNVLEDNLSNCVVTHYFTPMDKEYGCGTYARKMFIPKGTLLTGKIHKQKHLNFVMQGKITVITEHGTQLIEAPHIFISEPGVKRAGYAEEDTIWVTIHLTKHLGEDSLDKMEEEVTANSYDELGLLSSINNLFKLEEVL